MYADRINKIRIRLIKNNRTVTLEKQLIMKNTSNIHNDMFRDMQEKNLFHQTHKYALEYLDQAFDRNIFPTEEALSDLKHFEEDMPDAPSGSSEVLELLHKYGSPATVAQIGGRYFGFVNGSVVPAGLAAKNLATYWDQNTALQVISPIASKLETVVEKWLKQLFNLPDRAVAGFVSGTSSANFCGLAAARYRIFKNMGWDINEKGFIGAPQIRVVAGRHAHSAILKAVNLLGFGAGNIEWVDVDDQGRIIPEAIPELDSKTILILQAGNVNSGSFDPFDEICDKANKAKAWVHIDGAFGLWAAGSEKLKYLTKGMEKANSWAVDGHKTLNTPYDSGIVMCEDNEAIVSALHMTGGYIILGKERDGMFYTPEMSRRARVVELWATMKYLGRYGIDQMVEVLHVRAKQFAEEISRVEGFRVLNEVVFNQVIVSCASDELTLQTLKKVQEQRECWAGSSDWDGRKVIRVSVCSWATTAEDITTSVRSFEQSIS
jgi:glutamate/tyrosine decarboxylase-like PLP-dependent enzyme